MAEDAVPTAGLLLYVSLAFGISLAVNVWIFYRVSGGIFNPAVTLGVVLLGAMPAAKGAILAAAQILGGIFAAGLVEILLPGNLSVNTGLGAGASVVQGLFIEAILTFELTMTIYMLAVEKVRSHFSPPFLFPPNANPGVAPSNIHGTTRYWSCSFHCPSYWHPLHRSRTEPRSCLWAICHHQDFPNLPLDLL